ncbi:MAG: (Fe-S)-binding protein [Firmicutes bacterium]|nr:(Fe-S)-binding protein [Bacillota bacterium]
MSGVARLNEGAVRLSEGVTRRSEGIPLHFDENELENCMHCGFCLPACPTYRETALETASPRGRIALMKSVWEDRLPLSALEDQLSLCLGCRACETACPAGVNYGRLLEQGRAALRLWTAAQGRPPAEVAPSPAPPDGPDGAATLSLVLDSPRTVARRQVLEARRHGFGHWSEDFVLKRLFPSPTLLAIGGALLWFYQAVRLDRLLRRVNFFGFLPKHIAEVEVVLPRVPAPWARRPVVPHPPAAPETSTDDPAGVRAESAAPTGCGPRAAVFTGCVMDVVFHDTNVNTGRLALAAGARLIEAPGQTCCGALHAHAGDLGGARELARRNIAAFEASGADVIITNAGGCGAHLIEYPHLLQDEPEWAERARNFAARIQDISAFLVEQGYSPAGAAGVQDERLVYQDSCHLANGQQVRQQPRQLLKSLPSVEYRELAEADRCCGSAGIYNLVEPEMSGRLLQGKMENVKASQARVVVTSNPGCLLQMRLGIHRAGLDGRLEAMHIVDLLAKEVLDADPAAPDAAPARAAPSSAQR